MMVNNENNVMIGVNGFGRIGRLFTRQVILKNCGKIAAINDPMLTSEDMVFLLKYDSVHGTFPMDICTDGKNGICVNGLRIPTFGFKDARDIPWASAGVEYVAETSGQYASAKLSNCHIAAGAKKVVISATTRDDETPTFIMGVNEYAYNSSMQVVSNGSCTSNCLAPLLKLIHQQWGIEDCLMSTIHAMSASQRCVDTASQKDYRLGRCATRNIIPYTTGAVESVVKVLPELSGKLSGMSFRVPVENVSVLDLTCRLNKPMHNIQDLSNLLTAIEKDPAHPMYGILGSTFDPVVSSDFNGDERSCIVDASACIILNPTFVKLVAYYDNEWGYAARMMDLVQFMNKKDYEIGKQPQRCGAAEGVDAGTGTNRKSKK